MTLAQINYLMQVIECGSIKKAAEVLGIKRTTLQMSLDALEDELGQNILLRQKEGTVLAADSAALYPVLQKMQADISRMEALRQSWQQQKQLQIFSASAVLLPLLEKINSTYAAAQTTEKTVMQITAASAPTADFIFALKPPEAVPEGYCVYQLFDSPYCACLRNSHPLAQSEFIDLAHREGRYPLLLLTDDLQDCYDCQPIDHLSSLQRIISASDCLALIPEIFLKFDVVPYSRLITALQVQNCNRHFQGFLLARQEPQQSAEAEYLRYILSVFEECCPC